MTKLHLPLRLTIAAAAALAVILTLCITFASASSGHATVSRLVISTTLSTSSLDPSVSPSNWGTDELGFETLMRVEPNGALAPNLALSVSQPSPTKYLYHLR